MKQFEAILTFDHREQEIGRFNTSDLSLFHNEDQPSEAEVLFALLQDMTTQDRAHLRKISLCQYEVPDPSQAAAWIKDSGGKYYFHPYYKKEG